MTEQLRLFHDPEPDVPADAAPEAEPGPGAGSLDELFRLTPAWHTARGWLELLDGVGRFPTYSPLNGFLIRIQDREARWVATARDWARRYRRRLKPGARPITILARTAPVLFVFDVRDTEGAEPPAEAPPPPAAADRRLARSIDALGRHCREENIAMREMVAGPASERALRVTPAVKETYPGLERAARYLLLVEPGQAPDDRYAALVHELAHIFCGHLGSDRDAWWAERDDLDLERVEVEAASVAYLVSRRRGLHPVAGRLMAGIAARDRRLPAISLAAVLQATTHIEAMSRSASSRPPRRGR